MAAQTAATVQRESVGSLTLHIFTFASVTGADTFASGLGTSIVGQPWATNTFSGGTTTTGIGTTAINSSGTITFQLATAAQAVTLYILSKS